MPGLGCKRLPAQASKLQYSLASVAPISYGFGRLICDGLAGDRHFIDVLSIRWHRVAAMTPLLTLLAANCPACHPRQRASSCSTGSRQESL